MNVVYVMNDCKYCKLAKELMQRANLEYEEVLLDRDMTRQEGKETLQMEVVTFPQVVYNGKHLGGLIDTAKHFQSIGLV